MEDDKDIKMLLEIRNIPKTCEEFTRELSDKIESILKDPSFTRNLEIHRALSHKTRFLIYTLLQTEPLCTCALAKMLNLSEGTITHHIKILDKAGLIIGHKQGHFTIYYSRELFKKTFGL